MKALLGLTVLRPFRHAGAESVVTGADRILMMRSVQTEERIEVCYYRDGRYEPQGLDELNHFLRCHHLNEVKPIDVSLLDLLWSVRNKVPADGEIEVISGYRSFAYNALLRRARRKVGRDSFHCYGLAVDFAIPGVSNRRLARIARSLGGGGVGQYPHFVHIDVGPPRHWKSS